MCIRDSLSTLLEVLACGAKYYDHGQEADVLNILKRYDIDSVRLRLWNDPYSADGKPYGAGTNAVSYTHLDVYKRQGLILDLGCGTGKMTRLLAQAGYDMIGVDISEEMLGIARMQEAEDSGILYLNQDMREFELYGTVDVYKRQPYLSAQSGRCDRQSETEGMWLSVCRYLWCSRCMESNSGVI